MTAPVLDMDLALVESRTLRARSADRVDVLDKVKSIAMLPDDLHATTDAVAAYYEVAVKTIESVIEDHRDELASNGFRVLKGPELRAFVAPFRGVTDWNPPRARHLALFNRRAILNVGMLLRDSPIAQRVRRYLLDVEESTAPAQRATIAAGGSLPYKEQAEVLSILRPMLPENWATAKAKLIASRVLGEAPELDPTEIPLYASVYLEEQGHKRRTVEHFDSRFGLRASNRYFKVHGARPQKVDGPATSAHIKTINVYTQADRPILDEVYAEMAAEIQAFEAGIAAGKGKAA